MRAWGAHVLPHSLGTGSKMATPLNPCNLQGIRRARTRSKMQGYVMLRNTVLPPHTLGPSYL